jgi:hypothetical protein
VHLLRGERSALSGLRIIDCFARENPSYKQINVFYRVGEMNFAEPLEPSWLCVMSHDYPYWPPASTRCNIKSFRRCEVQLVIDTDFKAPIDETRERQFAKKLFTIWAMQSGYDNWQDERRHQGKEPCDSMFR